MNQKNDLDLAIAAFSRPHRLDEIAQDELPRVFHHAGAAQQKEVIARLKLEDVLPETFAGLWRDARQDDVRMELARQYSRPIPPNVFREIEAVGGGEALDVLRSKRPRVVGAYTG